MFFTDSLAGNTSRLRPEQGLSPESVGGNAALMVYVDILAVECVDPVAKFTDELKFTITFQCKTKPQEGKCHLIDWGVSTVRQHPGNSAMIIIFLLQN
jgi:hypothetical protein